MRTVTTGLVYSSLTAYLPAGAAGYYIGLDLIMFRDQGGYDDGYADDLSLVLNAPPLVIPPIGEPPVTNPPVTNPPSNSTIPEPEVASLMSLGFMAMGLSLRLRTKVVAA